MPITACNILANRGLKKKKKKKTRYSLPSAKFVVHLLSFIDIRTLELCIYVCVCVCIIIIILKIRISLFLGCAYNGMR